MNNITYYICAAVLLLMFVLFYLDRWNKTHNADSRAGSGNSTGDADPTVLRASAAASIWYVRSRNWQRHDCAASSTLMMRNWTGSKAAVLTHMMTVRLKSSAT